MAYDLIIAEHAVKQIDELAGYLVEDLRNPEAAKHFLDELEDVYKRLEENPLHRLVHIYNNCPICGHLPRHRQSP